MKPVRGVTALLAGALTLAGCTAGPTLTAVPPTPPVTTPAATPDRADEPGLSRPVADPVYPDYGNPKLDVLRYDLALAWSPARRELSGTATLTIRAVTGVPELTLDFSHEYTVDDVTVGGRAATSSWRADDIVVPATMAKDARVTLVVRYHGTPRPVPAPTGRSDMKEGVGLRPTDDGGAWTMQEPYGASTWYPANDQPSDEALYDVAVTVPTGWAAVAHGALAAVEPGKAGDTYHWHSANPVASYLATLAVGRYTKVTDTGPHGLPITYWLRTGRDERLLPALRRTPALLAWLEERFGPYPFPTAGVVIVDSSSAMETQQMVTYGARYGDPDSLDIVAETILHELAHQWFGDSVTPTDWRGLWINEGWAMYAEWMWTVEHRQITNATWVDYAREGDARSRPVAGPPGDPRPQHFGENNVYLGPALMLHEIHLAIGDDAFFALAHGWVRTHRDQQVTRDDFIAFVSAATGRNFTARITAWLDSPKTPSP